MNDTSTTNYVNIIDASCGQCRYFKPTEGNSGNCHTNPPTVFETENFRFDRRPKVSKTDRACRFLDQKGSE